MSKISTLLLLLCLVFASAVGQAQEVKDLAALDVQNDGTPVTGSVVRNALAAPVIEAASLKAAPAKVVKKAPVRPRKAVTSVADLTGKGVMTYGSLSTSAGAGGNSVTITAVGTDSVLITGFWTSTIQVKAAVDIAAKAISIPSQFAYTHTSYGEMDLAVANSTGKPDYTAPITGKINDDGSISIDTWWGIFVKTGTNKNKFVFAGYDTQIEKSNANMHVELGDTTQQDWNVVVTQTGKNIVSVKNFGNHGKTVEIVLNPDSTLSINQQLVWEGGSTMGNFYTLAADWSTGKTTSTVIKGKATASTLSWGNWVMLSTAKYYTGQLLNATITGQTYEIPVLTVTEWEGEGTEANPWKIKTLDDLVLLAQKVNTDAELNYGTYSPHTKSFLGKYFALQNDIDMTGYRFTPIGNAYTQRFAGTFDGQNHTLKGLNVSTGADGYAGLFGHTDTACVIKNLNMQDVKVATSYFYAGGVAGYSPASSFSNCHVTGTITSSGVAAGGIVSVARNVADCSFEGTIASTGGVNGGIAGEVYGTISNCWAKGSVSAGGPSDTYTVGGVVGTLYREDSKCLNSYFTGTIDATKHSNLFAGGVVGQCYRGQIDGCFSVADIYTSDYQSAAGGVVGVLQGDLSNSYATGYAICVSSKRIGGITGSVRAYTVTNGTATDTLQSSIKQCYYAGRLRAETYLYERDKEARETLGTIEDGAKPTIENVYFDQQMVDLTSLHYAAVTSDLTSASGPKGFSASKWTFTEGYYPRIKGIDDNDVAKLSASVLKLDGAFPDNFNYVSENGKLNLLGNTTAKLYVGGKFTDVATDMSIVADSLKLSGSFGVDTLVFYNPADLNIQPRIFVLKAAPRYFDGLGKEDNPFLIKNKADLMKLGELTTNVRQYYSGAYFLQTADIDMEYDTTFVGICDALTDYTYQSWAGTYDGGGHAIHRLRLNFVSWKTAPSDGNLGNPATGEGTRSVIYKGLFGQLANEGVVKNLTLAKDCKIEVWGFAGGFVGYSYGLIENCRNYADIIAYSGTVGGIVGNVNPGSVVRGCLNAGNVYTGFTTAGGIAGACSGTIEECQNVGEVAAKQLSKFVSTSRIHQAGGIVGSAFGAVLRNVVNAGHVYAQKNTGGIAGSMNNATKEDGANDVYQGINYGTVFTDNVALTGSIGGSGYNPAAKIENVYYDKQVTGLNAAANDAVPGVTASTTATLTSGKALNGYADSVWTFKAGQYPVLKRFADDALVQAAAKVIVSIKEGQTVKQLQANATLSPTEGTTWTLAQGKQFAVNGSTLQVPANQTIVTDTLTAQLGDFTKPFALQAVGPMPLAGSGTEADPWQLHNPAEWCQLANYIASTENSLEGSYVKVMNDFSFADTTFLPIAGDGVTPFAGTLLGNNATVKGIKFIPTASYQGSFGVLGSAGVIKDLTLQGTITTAKTYTGGFVGNLKGRLENCVNEVAVTSTALNAGGFAGNAAVGASIDHCTNKATISSTKTYLGGFIGQAAGAVTLTDCVNEGTIKMTAKSNYASGMIGSGRGTTFVRCVNKGPITSQGSYVAGLQGYTQGTDPVTVTDCHNEAAIEAVSSVAGLLGGMSTAGTTHPAVIATNCYNTGDISASNSTYYGNAGLFSFIGGGSKIIGCYNTGSVIASPKALYTGGIWGYAVSAHTEAQAVTVKNCYNTANIMGVNYAAGIGCYIPGYTTIDSCYNTGEISATFGAAGIGNVMRDYVNFNDCWNSGDISTTKQGAGGIAGYASYKSVGTRCFNTGNVTADPSTGSNAGGLGGQGTTVWINCYNRGTISAPVRAGGLQGEPRANTSVPYYSTSFYNCYNAGRVVNNDTLVGNIVGTTVSTAWKPGYNTVQNTYYVTDWGTYKTDTIGATAITIADLAKATDIAGDWSFGDDFTFPIIKGFEQNDCARAFAAAVVLREGDTYDNVAHGFNVGAPEGVIWSDANGEVWFDGNQAAATKATQDEDVLTATCGQYAAKWPVKFNTTTGVSETSLGNKPVASRAYYNVAGIQVQNLEPGQVYIEVIRYTDGTTVSKKLAK